MMFFFFVFVFFIMDAEYNDCSSFVDLLFIPWSLGLKHHLSSTFHRRKPWQNLIDVAELDRNVTKRERSKQNVAGREET